MTPRDSRLDAIAIVALIVGSIVNACEPLRVGADDWTEQEVLIARLAINEASGRDADTIAITQARGGYSVERLRADHHRALAPVRTDSRRWIAGLDADMSEPIGWPSHRLDWPTFGVAMWTRTLATVRATLRGERGCAGGRPDVWGGTMDHERIARIVAHGGVIVDCGHTANTYLRLGDGR